MTRALLLLALPGVAWLVVNEPRRRSYRALLRRCYRCMDEALGLRTFELDRRAGMRRKWGWLLPKELVGFLWPATEFGGVAALPFFGRRQRYLHLRLRPVPWPRRFHTWHVQGVDAHWTSEVRANAGGFVERAERAFADFLFLKHTAGVFDTRDHRDDHPPAGMLTITRAKPAAAVPDQLAAHEELA
jgi:hypothetical protein